MEIFPFCCLPSYPVIAGAICATGTFIVRRKLSHLAKKQKPKTHRRCFGLDNKKKTTVSSLIKAFRTRKSLALHKKIRSFCRNNVANRSLPKKLNGRSSEDWRDNVLEIDERYQVNMDVPFQYALSYWKQEQAEKIAEGSYGEVYTFPHVDGSLRILKFIPVDNRHPLKESPNLPLTLAITDIVCSVSLSKLNDQYLFTAPNFPEVYRVCIVKDKFPNSLMEAWLSYKRKSETTQDPTIYPQPDLYRENQRFLTIETSHCGNPLTRKTLQSTWLAASIMTQLVAALAVAEEACGFEHRDLHLGNILVKHTEASELKYTLRDSNFSVKTVCYQVFIIDFTLSRITDGSKIFSVPMMESAEQVSPSSEEDWLNYENLYGKMMDVLNGDWKQFNPKTNILWLKYVNEKLIDFLCQNQPSLRNLVASSSMSPQMTPMRMLRKWNDCILNHDSATDFLKDVVLFENPLVKFLNRPHEVA